MKKKRVFGVELLENELKTLKNLIEVKNGKLTSLNLTLKQIADITKIDSGSSGSVGTATSYQYVLLKKLIDLDVVKKENKKYSIKTKFLESQTTFDDHVFSDVQDNITNLESSGRFKYHDTTIFGINSAWCNYPEMAHLHQMTLNIMNSLYSMKQIKSICLLRDFSKKWDEIIKSDLPGLGKQFLWDVAHQHLTPYVEPKGINKLRDDRYKDYENLITKSELEEIKEEDKRKSQYNVTSESYFKEFGERLGKLIINRNKLQTRWILEVLRTILNDNQWKELIDVLDGILVVFPREVNEIALYSDIGNMSDPLGNQIKIPDDIHEKNFKNLHASDRNIQVMNSIVKNLDKDHIDEILQESSDVLDSRNNDRFRNRFWDVLDNMKKPFPKEKQSLSWEKKIKDKGILSDFIRDYELILNLEDDIVEIAKKENWNGCKSKTDDRIYTLIRVKGFRLDKSVIKRYLIRESARIP